MLTEFLSSECAINSVNQGTTVSSIQTSELAGFLNRLAWNRYKMPYLTIKKMTNNAEFQLNEWTDEQFMNRFFSLKKYSELLLSKQNTAIL